MIATAAPLRGSLTLATALLWVTLIYNIVEGAVGVAAGAVAGSVALMGFGLDSFIEVTAAGVLLWRLRMPDGNAQVEARELLARRIVGATFVLMAAYVLGQTAYVLAPGNEPETSTIGIGLAAASFVLMPALGLAKRRNARLLHSHALIAESTETLVCSYLSVTLFIGLGANAVFGWWWADVAAALAMVPWIAKEGREGLRGEAGGDDCDV